MVMKKKFIFVSVVLFMLLLSAIAVFADVLLYRDDFDDDYLNQTIWINNSCVFEDNGSLVVPSNTAPNQCKVWLRNPINRSSGNIVIEFNFTRNVSNPDYNNDHIFFAKHTVSTIVGSALKSAYTTWFYASDRFGDFRDEGTANFNLGRSDGFITARIKWNATHFCGQANGSLGGTDPFGCDTDVPSNDTLEAGFLHVGDFNEEVAYIDSVEICIDDNDDNYCFAETPYTPPVALSVEWDSESPANETITNDDPIIFDFNVNGSNSSVRCDLYSNDTGTFTIEDYETSLGNGSFDLEYDTGASQEDYLILFVNCFDGNQSVNTSFKYVTVDKVNVLIDIVSPTATTYYFNFTDNVFANISFDNELLDFVYFNITYSNGSLLYYNSSTPGVAEFSFLENVTLAALGTYTLNAWGNDSASNVASDSVSFTYSVYMVTPPPEPTQFTFLSLVPLVVMIFALYWFWGMFFKK